MRNQKNYKQKDGFLARLKLQSLQVSCRLGLITAIIALALCGCSKRFDDLPAFFPLTIKDYDNHSVGRFKTSYLAEQIDGFYKGANPGPLGVTTFVNLDDLYHTSSFGRMVSEQLMSELTMRGFDVVELRHSDALHFMETTGELALSRDVGQVRKERQLGGVIVGTYLASPERVYVNARLIDPSTSVVLSAGSVEMEKTSELKRLIRSGGSAPTLERIPVKHLGFSTYSAGAFPQQGRSFDLEEESAYAPAQPLPAGPAPQVVPEASAQAATPTAPTVVEPKLVEKN